MGINKSLEINQAVLLEYFNYSTRFVVYSKIFEYFASIFMECTPSYGQEHPPPYMLINFFK